jgi:hypothetical protein
LALTFLKQYHKNGSEFLHHIVQIAGDETWVSFVNVETKKQSKQWMHHIYQASQTSLSKRCLPTVFWDRT